MALHGRETLRSLFLLCNVYTRPILLMIYDQA